ncbi:hypothetical protein Tco_0549643 [Tanacetum coccineum]
MIQPEPEGSTQGYPLVSVEVLRGKRCEKNYLSVRSYIADPDNAYPKRSITKLILKGAVTFDVVSYQFRCALNYSKLVSKAFETASEERIAKHQSEFIHNEDGNPLEQHAHKPWLFKDGGGVKEVQRSFRHSDTERLSRSDEVLKLKNFKKDATLKLSKSTNQERYEHVGPEVASSQDGKVSRWRRDCAWLMISRCSRSQCQIQVQGTSSIQKSMITTTYSQEKVKTLTPATSSAASTASLKVAPKSLGFNVGGKRCSKSLKASGGFALGAKMVSAPVISRPPTLLDFETSVFNKEKINLAGYDEVIYFICF